MITISPKAIEELHRLKPFPTIRVSIKGGGCSGMTYHLEFDNSKPLESDKFYTENGILLVVDVKSHLYLDGTELDFTDGLNGTGFVFNNPNAKRTCGCGNSFSS